MCYHWQSPCCARSSLLSPTPSFRPGPHPGTVYLAVMPLRPPLTSLGFDDPDGAEGRWAGICRLSPAGTARGLLMTELGRGAGGRPRRGLSTPLCRPLPRLVLPGGFHCSPSAALLRLQASSCHPPDFPEEWAWLGVKGQKGLEGHLSPQLTG